MILEREHGRKPNIDQPEMKSPNRKEDKWKGIEHEFGKIKVHVVPTVTDGSWRPSTMRSTPSLLDGGSTLCCSVRKSQVPLDLQSSLRTGEEELIAPKSLRVTPEALSLKMIFDHEGFLGTCSH